MTISDHGLQARWTAAPGRGGRRRVSIPVTVEHGPRPIVQVGSTAGMAIIRQAPGRRVNDSGVPWDDPGGRTLRDRLDITDGQFDDPETVARIPTGFCYPGSSSSGDKPPRPECAPRWHERLLAELPGGAVAARHVAMPTEPVAKMPALANPHILGPRLAALPVEHAPTRSAPRNPCSLSWRDRRP